MLGWLVLEHMCPDLVFKHYGMFCDNCGHSKEVRLLQSQEGDYFGFCSSINMLGKHPHSFYCILLGRTVRHTVTGLLEDRGIFSCTAKSHLLL